VASEIFTSCRQIISGRSVSKNSKNPFLIPTVMQNKDMIQEMIMDTLKELEKEE